MAACYCTGRCKKPPYTCNGIDVYDYVNLTENVLKNETFENFIKQQKENNMMKKEITKKAFVLLDRSGSMETMWEEAISGINSYVKNLEDCDVYVAAFDTQDYEVVRNCSREEWKPIKHNEISPRGGTPLLDASGRIMWSMLDSGADRAMLIIVTDGFENSSKHFTKQTITDMTKKITTEKNYDMVFLGANFDKIGDVAKQNFGWADTSRIAATSVRGYGEAMLASASVKTDYFNKGIRVEQLYSNAQKDAFAKK